MKKFKILIVVCVTLFAMPIIFLYKRNIVTEEEHQKILKKDSPRKRPLILEWIPPYHKRCWKIPNSQLCGGGCDITQDRKQYENSDALVFYMKGTKTNDLPDPSKRLSSQVFVWWCHESPDTVKTYWRKKLTEFDNYFNWTMHYRADSHVTASFIPHTARDWYLHKTGRSEESEIKTLKRYTSDKEFDIMFDQLMVKKSKFTSWVVSDCDDVPGAVRRLELAKKLQSEEKLEIDIYGKCGTKKLSKDIPFFDHLQTYKFYLAFENTKYCKDYITEKFWYNSLYAGTVPVIWGSKRSDVEKIAPPNSFIHFDDFDGNLTQFGDYLKMLDKNVTAYKEYFRWWTMPGFYPIHNFREDKVKNKTTVSECNCDFEVNAFCHLCKLLNERKQYNTKNVITSLKEEFYEKENPECGFLEPSISYQSTSNIQLFVLVIFILLFFLIFVWLLQLQTVKERLTQILKGLNKNVVA